MTNDTIIALATPPGKSALAVIRVSGPDAISLAGHFFYGKRQLCDLAGFHAAFGLLKDNDEIIDEAIVTVFRNPQSYTGEDMVELSVHGSSFVVRRVLEVFQLRGARLAEPGEFTQRAFLNNKMDLIKAESVIDLIESETKFSYLAANQRVRGVLSKRVEKLRQQTVELLGQLELSLDFAEEDIAIIETDQIEKRLQKGLASLRKLERNSDEGLLVNNGIRIAIVGPPNSGKSTLFNYFLGHERAIVSGHAGTTRDYLEAEIAMSGIPVILQDTAGIRQSDDVIERAGIALSGQLAEEADLVLCLFAQDAPLTESFHSIQQSPKTIVVQNKCDDFTANAEVLMISAQTGTGIDRLKQEILSRLRIDEADLREGVIGNLRQLQCIRLARTAFESAMQTLMDQMPNEFIAEDLRKALKHLQQFLGTSIEEDILNQIFSRFCIGK